MAEPADRRGPKRRRGNPRWGQPLPPVPAVTTQFEFKARQLGLTAETYVSSRELKRWCEQNLHRLYIPEWLLSKWCLQVRTNSEDVA